MYAWRWTNCPKVVLTRRRFVVKEAGFDAITVDASDLDHADYLEGKGVVCGDIVLARPSQWSQVNFGPCCRDTRRIFGAIDSYLTRSIEAPDPAEISERKVMTLELHVSSWAYCSFARINTKRALLGAGQRSDALSNVTRERYKSPGGLRRV